MPARNAPNSRLWWLISLAVIVTVLLALVGGGLWIWMRLPGPPDALEVLSAAWEPGDKPKLKVTFRLRRRDWRPAENGGVSVGLYPEQDALRNAEALNQHGENPEYTYTAGFRSPPPEPVRVKVTAHRLTILSIPPTEDAPSEPADLFSEDISLPPIPAGKPSK